MGFAEAKQAYISEEEYVQGEEFSALKHEYLDGQVLLYPYPPESGTKKG